MSTSGQARFGSYLKDYATPVKRDADYNRNVVNAQIAAGFFPFSFGTSFCPYLFVPIISTRRAMVTERDKRLSELSDQFSKALNLEATPERGEKLQSIHAEYTLTKDSWPAGPIRWPKYRGLQAFSLVPPAIGLTAALLNLMRK